MTRGPSGGERAALVGQRGEGRVRTLSVACSRRRTWSGTSFVLLMGSCEMSEAMRTTMRTRGKLASSLSLLHRSTLLQPRPSSRVQPVHGTAPTTATAATAPRPRAHRRPADSPARARVPLRPRAGLQARRRPVAPPGSTTTPRTRRRPRPRQLAARQVAPRRRRHRRPRLVPPRPSPRVGLEGSVGHQARPVGLGLAPLRPVDCAFPSFLLPLLLVSLQLDRLDRLDRLDPLTLTRPSSHAVHRLVPPPRRRQGPRHPRPLDR